MAKRGVFFQFYLNPRNLDDQTIITWLHGIPRYHRSRTIKTILLAAIHDQPCPVHAVTVPTGPEATQAARKLFASMFREPLTGS
jgi:hypothetical protein